MQSVLIAGYWSGLIIALALDYQSANGQGPAKHSPMPRSGALKKVAADYFATQPDLRPGDLICRTDAEPLLDKLSEAGWQAPDGKKILASLLPPEHVLVKKLRSAKGKGFMRRISADPSAYDRLERLISLPGGERTLQDLIEGPDGHKLINYMTQTSGGHELGKQLSRSSQGRNFNEPTGRIYTAEALVQRLESSWSRAERPSTSGAAP